MGRYFCQSSERRGRNTAEEEEEGVEATVVVGWIVDDEDDEDGGMEGMDLEDDGGMGPPIMNIRLEDRCHS